MVEQTHSTLLFCDTALTKPRRPASFLCVIIAFILVDVSIYRRRNRDCTVFTWGREVIGVRCAVILAGLIRALYHKGKGLNQ